MAKSNGKNDLRFCDFINELKLRFQVKLEIE